MLCQAACINKKLAKCHTREFTRFGESVSQRADKPPVLSESWKHTRAAN